MPALSVSCVVMAAINFCVAIFYFFMFLKRPLNKEALPFAVLCLFVAFYDVLCAGRYNSHSVVAGASWQRLQLYMVFIISMSMNWFVGVFTEREESRAIKLFNGLLLAVLIVTLFVRPEFYISAALPAIKHINVMNVLKTTCFEAEIGILGKVEFFLAMTACGYLFYIVIDYYRKKRRGVVLVVAVGLFVCSISSFNDMLMAMQFYSSFYISEYGFFIFVIGMAYTLLNNFVDIQTEFEKLNIGLEQKIRERTLEIEKIHTQLLQSEKMAIVGQLTGGLAHEINNPVGVILGFSQAITKRIKEDDPMYMPLKSIEREAIRCKKLIAELLLFSRSGKVYFEKIQINEIIEETIGFVGVQAGDKKIEIVKRYDCNLPKVAINKNQIQQIIVNICNNAFDAMPDGGKLIIATRKAENLVAMEITDTGTGMTEEVKEHIFEPFFTTKEVGKGTGLGLSLCYEIIQKHNGSIEVISEVNKGTTFIVKLPVDQTGHEKLK
jgi:signal transduction histidine kinase